MQVYDSKQAKIFIDGVPLEGFTDALRPDAEAGKDGQFFAVVSATRNLCLAAKPNCEDIFNAAWNASRDWALQTRKPMAVFDCVQRESTHTTFREGGQNGNIVMILNHQELRKNAEG